MKKILPPHVIDKQNHAQFPRGGGGTTHTHTQPVSTDAKHVCSVDHITSPCSVSPFRDDHDALLLEGGGGAKKERVGSKKPSNHEIITYEMKRDAIKLVPKPPTGCHRQRVRE